MPQSCCFLLAGILSLMFCGQTVSGQISKAHQILMDRGLQVQGMVANYDVFHLNTYSNAHYTAIHWIWASTPSWMGPAPGFPWARWAGDETQVPPIGEEGFYMSQLIMLQLGDEWHLNDDAVRNRAVNWFDAIRADFPNTIVFMNNYGGQVSESNLADFITRAQPDMLCFDTYPWRSVYSTNPEERVPISGPPTAWYSECRIYRDMARGANIPYATYVQTFRAIQDYDSTVYRDPSASELRLNHSAALAFNAKALIDFTYNTSASSLFTAPGGDSHPTALFADKVEANLRARNLGKALVRLKPIDEATAQWTTSMVFVRGKDSAGVLNPIPINFYAGPAGANPHTDWVADRNDPFLRGWVVTNTGTRNNGQPGDVIIAWFKLLDESFDGPEHTNQIYFMVVNGLSDPAGSAADCAQEIKLNFLNSFTAVEILDPMTGTVQVQTLPEVNTRRQLVLNLGGGDAALFKISTGAPFAGAEVVGPPVITAQPASRVSTSGADASFGVTAAGSSPLSYQWRFGGVPISGATERGYTRTNVQAADAGEYTVVVTNALGSVTSAVATLIVHAPPQITVHPQSRIVSAGSNVIFAVTASGSPSPVYQWRFNGVNIPGATASNYTRLNAQSADAGDYSVIVSNIAGVEFSSNATLMVNGPPSITAQPEHRAVLVGGTATFHVTAVGAPVLAYQWKKDGTNLADSATISGAAESTLTVSGVQTADLGTYSVSVSNGFGGAVSDPATLTLASAPTIQAQPQSRTNQAGTTATFQVVASGGGLHYQWRRAGTNVVNSTTVTGVNTDTLMLNTVLRADAASYTVVITNAAGSVTSAPATLTVLFPLPWRDPFHYPEGDNIGGKLSPDFLHWGDVGTNTAGSYVRVAGGSLHVAGLASAYGNSVEFGGVGKGARFSVPVGNPFNSGTIYYSFALRVDDLAGASASGAFIAGFNNSTGSQGNEPTVIGTRVLLRTSGQGFNLGLSKSSSTGADWSWDGTVFEEGETVFLVGSYTFTTLGNTTDDISRLWINPSATDFGAASAPEPTLIATAGNDIGANQIASFLFFRRAATVIPSVMIADDLRIGTNWASVTPSAIMLRIESIGLLPDDKLRLRGSGDPGELAIEASADLANWTEVTSLFSASGNFEYIEPNAVSAQRFYRARRR